MIIKEDYGYVYNSEHKLYLYYSDQNLQIQQVETGVIYNCVVDLDIMHYTYVETEMLRTDLEEEVN